MKRMKMIMMTLVMSLGVLNAFTQERVNETKLNYINISEKFTDKTQWFKNEYGDWEKRESSMFNSIRVGKFNHNDETYYMFLIEQNKVGYKYPRIQKDPYYYDNTLLYTFDSINYNKLKEFISYKSGEDSIFVTTYTWSVQEKVDNTLSTHKAITESIKSIENNYSFQKQGFIVNTQTLNGSDILRFDILESYSDYFDKNLKIKDIYFETDLSLFSIILID